MFGLPADYLEIYRSQIQAVTIAQVQEVAQKYVRPDAAAVVIVGDGAQLAGAGEPYAAEIEFYNTAGKKRSRPSVPPSRRKPPRHWRELVSAHRVTTWPEHSRDPNPANIGKGFSGKVTSEMGNGELLSVTFDGESFAGTISFDIAGQAMEAQIAR